MIRDYEPTRDEGPLRECIVALQEFERTLEPALPKGEAMADAYLAFLFDRCAAAAGRVFVAEVDRAVVGFVGVLAEVPPAEPDEEQAPYAYVSDLVVLPTYRRRGIGRALLDRAEAFARERGARMLRVAVLAKNRPAGELYRSLGFSDYVVQLSKMLSPLPIEHLPTREGYDLGDDLRRRGESPHCAGGAALLRPARPGGRARRRGSRLRHRATGGPPRRGGSAGDRGGLQR